MMPSTWNPAQFDRDMQALMEAKLPISESKIKSLKNTAMSYPQHYQDFVASIERFLRTSPFDYKLAGMYVIDAISRSAHATWRKKGDAEDGVTAKHILESFEVMFEKLELVEIFRKCTEKDKGKLNKTVDIWGRSGILSQDVVDHLKKGLSSVASPVADNQKAQTNDPNALLATLASIAKNSQFPINVPANMQPEPSKDGPANHSVDDFDYGDDDDTSHSHSNNINQNNGQEMLPAALANLLDTLKQNSPSVSNNIANDNTSNSPNPPAQTLPVTNTANTFDYPIDVNLLKQIANPPPQGDQNWQGPPVPPIPQQRNAVPSASPPPNSYRSPGQSGQMRPPPPATNAMRGGPRNAAPSLLDHPAKINASPPVPEPPANQSFGNSIVFDDPALPEGSIRVLTRTLFVGPLPETMTKQQIRERFAEYGNVSSVVVHKTKFNMVNAFLKFDRRQALDHIKSTMKTFQMNQLTVKVNWASGFGPKTYFNYELGEAIVPLSAYTEIERGYLVTGYYGGFQGTPFRDRATIEEPDVEYRPPQSLEPVGAQAVTAAPNGSKMARPPPNQPPMKREMDSTAPMHRDAKRMRNGPPNPQGPWPPMAPPGAAKGGRPPPPPMVNTPNGPMPMFWPPPPGFKFPPFPPSQGGPAHQGAPGPRPPPNFTPRRNED